MYTAGYFSLLQNGTDAFVDWTLIGNWILQGIILGGFAMVGIYAGLRLYGRQTGRRMEAGEGAKQAPKGTGHDKKQNATGAGGSPFTGVPSPAGPGTKVESRDGAANDIRHAIEFDDDRVSMILDLPAGILDDDRALVEAWVEAVGWARIEQMRKDRRLKPLSPMAAGAAMPIDEPERLQAQLDEMLQRLQISAERRRHLRALLETQVRPLEES